ncbi:galactokinase [Sphingobacterium composti Ten et al. 2007 non Yoo et al. 2007]|uniref:galactokinase n=1 Tax=Sphingobacterium composti TaxID=363260 RepID=UPI0013595AF4|nr:galactokinase [Sphingobacterium composti Ten et al. 2007 non Yoo et al. 2007]
MSLVKQIKDTFLQVFNSDPQIIAKSPGRINVIGEHTDYNNGFVLPAAIDKGVYIGLSAREDDQIELFSIDYNEKYTTDTTSLIFGKELWTNYILGVTRILSKQTDAIKGYNLVVVGDVPLGSGLSSSAALTCATSFSLGKLFNLNLSKLDIAKIGQQTEHEAVGVRCGIMDQFASVFGQDNSLIKLDCRSLEYEYIPIQLEGYEILLLNTNVKHSLASSAYNKRRESCEAAVALVKEKYDEVDSLRDVTLAQLDELVKPVNEEYYQKARFVIQENERLLKATEALKANNITTLGKLLYQAHWALSKEYEVSCEELDFLVDTVSTYPEVAGARMMGGGFGGCTINIVQKGKSKAVIEKLTDLYFNKFSLNLIPIEVSISNGTHEIY